MRALLITMAVLALQPEANRPSFSEWLDGVRREAIERGIRQEIVDEALADVEEPMPVVLERDRAQAEAVFSLEKYVARQLTRSRIRIGRDRYATNRELLEQIGSRYGVAPHLIAGVWGMETNFGRFSGVRPTIAALATLAWDPRRAAFFRGELFDALEILNRGHIDFASMKGSWAGAMGQPQFMPSSYLKFAEDYDGDGHKDIWTNAGDVFASIANYLKGHGWVEGELWGREVAVPAAAAKRIAADVPRREDVCRGARSMTVALPMERWRALGVTLPGGKALPKTDLQASLVAGTTRHFLVYRNFNAILDYNCSLSYAVSVALLGDAVASDAPLPAAKKASRRRAER
jgi:membrane-bound lytic murein transglycosylase B